MSLISVLSQETGLSAIDVRAIVRTAPRRYKSFYISKRRGGKRLISQPSRELKALQRVLVNQVISKLPVHSAAMAYRNGISITDNARMHAGVGSILKLDFSDFFGSIRDVDWRNYCYSNAVFDDDEDVEVSTRILFFKREGFRYLRLAIGAPSSPSLSNVLMHNFDTRVCGLVSGHSVVYTRYADDLTFSAPRTGFLTVVRAAVQRAINEVAWPRLCINDSKTVVATMKYKREVTGLVLANDGSVSLGHERKKCIRAGVHWALTGKLGAADLDSLQGLLSFASDVEPAFIARLETRYGRENIWHLRSARNMPE